MSMAQGEEEKRRLYLVLDDSMGGCSIRKVDVGSFGPDDNDDLDTRAQPLPDPLIRVEGRDSALHFVALGTKIFALQPPPAGSGGAAPALDTRTMAISTGPLPRASLIDQELYSEFVFVAVGDDRIYSMDHRLGRDDRSSFQVLRLVSSGGGWSWSTVPSRPPFDPIDVRCYAVHPDKRTIFFSVECSDGLDSGATFSFDTEALKWTLRGYWMLPLEGEAHYDVELDAWVGFHRSGHGRLASCDVLPPATGDEDADRRQEKPASKKCKDGLFRTKGSRHIGGGLMYMGGSMFCILECVVDRQLTKKERKKVNWQRAPAPGLHLYMRTFRLKYSKEGRLRVATTGRRARCYCLPKETGYPKDYLIWTLRALWL